MLRNRLGGRLRHPGIPDTGIAVRLRCQQRWLNQRQRKPACHRDIPGVRQFKHSQCIGQCLLHRTVAVHHAYTFHLKLRRC